MQLVGDKAGKFAVVKLQAGAAPELKPDVVGHNRAGHLVARDIEMNPLDGYIIGQMRVVPEIYLYHRRPPIAAVPVVPFHMAVCLESYR